MVFSKYHYSLQQHTDLINLAMLELGRLNQVDNIVCGAASMEQMEQLLSWNASGHFVICKDPMRFLMGCDKG
jgi:hypothetical protein